MNLAEGVFTSAIQILRKILGTDNTENEDNSVADIRENSGGNNGFLIPEKNNKKGKSVNEIEFFQLTAGSQGNAGIYKQMRMHTSKLHVYKFVDFSCYEVAKELKRKYLTLE